MGKSIALTALIAVLLSGIAFQPMLVPRAADGQLYECL